MNKQKSIITRRIEKNLTLQHQPITKKTVEGSRMTRLGDLQAQAQQRRERLERLIPAATAGISAVNDISLLRAGVAADKAQREVYQKANQEFKRVQPDISARLRTRLSNRQARTVQYGRLPASRCRIPQEYRLHGSDRYGRGQPARR
jgi:hypothetical protein